MSAGNDNQMKAVQIHSYGNAAQLSLDDVAIPQPADGEILVKVHAAGVNPVDWKIREGYLSEILPHSLPLTLGWDFAGDVAAIGNMVDGWKIGDAVYAHSALIRNGSYAEYVTVSAKEVAPKPKSLTWEEAAGVPLVTLTAWQALNDIGQMKQGDRILIHAGAGGVGIAAIQLAKHAGAHVVTTASEKNATFLKALGADEVIDYTRQDFSQSSGFDIALDTLGAGVLAKTWKTLKKGGHLISTAEVPNTDLAEQYGVTASFCFVQPNSNQLREITNLIDSGALSVKIDSVFPLDQVAQAHAKSESGHARGKIIVQVLGG